MKVLQILSLFFFLGLGCFTMNGQVLYHSPSVEFETIEPLEVFVPEDKEAQTGPPPMFFSGTVSQEYCYGASSYEKPLELATSNMVYGSNCPVFVKINYGSTLHCTTLSSNVDYVFYKYTGYWVLSFTMQTGVVTFNITDNSGCYRDLHFIVRAVN